MNNWKGYQLCLLLAAICLLPGCSGSFDAETGNYSYKDLSLQFPQGWAKIKTTPGALITVGNTDKLRQIDVMVREIPETITFDQYITQMASHYSRIGTGTGGGPMTLGGIEGHWSGWMMSVGGHRFRTIVYSVMKGNKVYSVVCIAQEDEFPSYEDAFDGVASSIIIS